jgi:hypothetical protein
VRKFVICSVFSLYFAGVAQGGGQSPSLEKENLVLPAEIHGYPCARGPAVFYDGTTLESCRLNRDAPFGEARLPAGSVIHLTPEGQFAFALLSRPTMVGGHACQGDGRVNPVVFYPGGKLKECWLASPEQIQGVPCARSTPATTTSVAGGSAEFYENGKLRRCTLSRPLVFEDVHLGAGAHIVLDADGRLEQPASAAPKP